MLPLSKKVKVLDLMRKEKKSYAEVAEIYSKDVSFIHEILKKDKEICAGFAVVCCTTVLCDKCLVKMEKALNLYNKVF